MRKRTTRRRKTREAARLLGGGVELVRSAAVLLDQELAVGVTAAKAVQQRVQRERRVDAADFREALQRFQANGRELVTAISSQLDGSKLTQNVELAKRFIAKANDLVDLTVGVVGTSAELANEFVQANRRDAGPRRKSRR